MQKFLLPLGLFIFSCVLLATPAWAMTIDEFEVETQKLLDGKIAPDDFIKISKAVIEKDVQSDVEYLGMALAWQAHAYYLKKDKKRAYESANKAIEANPKTVMGYVVLSEILAWDEKWSDAAEAMQKVIDNGQSLEPEAKDFYTSLMNNYKAQASAISPTELCAVYEENELAADEKYKDKWVAVKGKIRSIGKHEATGKPMVNLETGEYSINSVRFVFNTEDKEDIMKLKKGQQVTLYGECKGQLMGDVFLINSKIL